jgi:anti-sigma regulatory factor (Ser/Thr protein kinase)
MATADSAVPALRRFAGGVAGRWGVPAAVVDTARLVVSELVTNAVLHSGAPDVTVLLAHRGDGLSIEVADRGQWCHRSAPRRAPEDEDAACGRGLELVKGVSAWWRAVLTPAGSRIAAYLPFAGPTDPVAMTAAA